MRRLTLLSLLVLCACPVPDGLDGWAPLFVSAECGVQEANALRVDCVAEVESELEVTFRWTADGEPIRELESPSGTGHRVTWTELRAGTEYAWEARANTASTWKRACAGCGACTTRSC